MNWHDRLRKVEEHSVMTVKLQSEVDKYKVRVVLMLLFRNDVCSIHVCFYYAVMSPGKPKL